MLSYCNFESQAEVLGKYDKSKFFFSKSFFGKISTINNFLVKLQNESLHDSQQFDSIIIYLTSAVNQEVEPEPHVR